MIKNLSRSRIQSAAYLLYLRRIASLYAFLLPDAALQLQSRTWMMPIIR